MLALLAVPLVHKQACTVVHLQLGLLSATQYGKSALCSQCRFVLGNDSGHYKIRSEWHPFSADQRFPYIVMQSMPCTVGPVRAGRRRCAKSRDFGTKPGSRVLGNQLGRIVSLG